MLHIVVCVKAVPDPKLAGKIKIDPATGTLLRSDIPLVGNALDRHALEAALRIKERLGASVTVLSMGPPEAANVVRENLALGADQGILLSDPAFGGADAYATATTLAKAIMKLGLTDVIFCGAASSDSGTEWVGPELAVFLNMAVVTRVSEIVAAENDQWAVKTELDNGYRLARVTLPAVLTVTRELNTPRPLSFSGIVKARKKEIVVWGRAELDLPEETVGRKGSPTTVTAWMPWASQRTATMIEGTLEEKTERLLQKLIEAGGL